MRFKLGEAIVNVCSCAPALAEQIVGIASKAHRCVQRGRARPGRHRSNVQTHAAA